MSTEFQFDFISSDVDRLLVVCALRRYRVFLQEGSHSEYVPRIEHFLSVLMTDSEKRYSHFNDDYEG